MIHPWVSMRRAALLSTIALCGCTMCQDCFDDDAPVIGSAVEGSGSSGPRAGSVLADAEPVEGSAVDMAANPQ